MVWPRGRVLAAECDEELAARARISLNPWHEVDVVHGDGRTHNHGEVDVIIVFAGSTHPAPLWLDRLAPGGQLELAARARISLNPWHQVDVVHGDGRTHDPGEVDVIIVFAGSTHPAPLWLDRLAPGGQLLMPLTSENLWGFLFRATRCRDYDAESIVLPAA